MFRMITRRGGARRGPGRGRSRRHHRLLQPGRRRDGGPQRRRRGDGRRRPGERRGAPSCASSSTRWPIPTRADEMDGIIERFGEVQARFEELGGYALEARAREILAGLGFSAGDDGRRRRRAVGRLEDARRARAHPADAARRDAARRADQPPRPRKPDLARAVPQGLRRRAADDLARPRVHEPRRHQDRRDRRRRADHATPATTTSTSSSAR